MSKIAKALNKAKLEKLEHRRQTPQDQLIVSSPTPVSPQVRHSRTCQPRPHLLEDQRVLNGSQDQALKDTYNLLRTQLLHKTRDQGWNTFMITSALRGEGKSTTCVNLGLSLATEAVQTALVVDTNFRHPRLDQLLDLQCQRGLSDYLLGEAELADLLIRPNQDSFLALPAGRRLKAPTDMLSSSRMKDLVRELKTRYPDRYVLFDCPQVLDMPDTLLFASYVDAILMVVEAGRTTTEEIEMALELLQDRNVIGLVLNKTREEA